MTPKILIPNVRSDCAVKHILTPVSYSHSFFLDEEYEARLLCLDFFGRMLHFGELAAICGGELGTTEITVGVAKSGLYLEYQHPVTGCIGACLIYRTADMQLVLVNEHIRFLQRDRIEKKKFHWFSRQKAACESLGISTIHITGSKSSISQGYYFYPLFGFNAPIPPDFLHLLSKEIAQSRTLLDLYENPQGRKIWFLCGFPCDMVFDLDERNNTSQFKYAQYLDSQCLFD